MQNRIARPSPDSQDLQQEAAADTKEALPEEALEEDSQVVWVVAAAVAVVQDARSMSPTFVPILHFSSLNCVERQY